MPHWNRTAFPDNVIHMDKLTLAVRIVVGLIFFVFGLNGFIGFLPDSPTAPGVATEYISALKRTGYFWPVLKGCEVACGLCLLSGYFVPLALVVIAPVVVHIFLFHVFLSPPLGLGLFLLVAEAYLGWAYRGSFAGLMKATT